VIQCLLLFHLCGLKDYKKQILIGYVTVSQVLHVGRLVFVYIMCSVISPFQFACIAGFLFDSFYKHIGRPISDCSLWFYEVYILRLPLVPVRGVTQQYLFLPTPLSPCPIPVSHTSVYVPVAVAGYFLEGGNFIYKKMSGGSNVII